MESRAHQGLHSKSVFRFPFPHTRHEDSVRALFGLSASVLVPALVALVLNLLFDSIHWKNVTLLASSEGVEAFGTLVLAIFLYVQKKYAKDAYYLRWVVGALICLAGFEIVSPFSSLYPALHWSRTYGHLLAGILLGLVWIPNTQWTERLSDRAFYWTVATATALLIFQMIVFGPTVSAFRVSPTASVPHYQVANLIAGTEFFAAAAFFLLKHLEKKGRSSLVLSYYFSFLAMMRILLSSSGQWTATWWFVYGIRMTAILAVLYYLFVIFRQSLETAETGKNELEERVQQRTRDLAHANSSLLSEIKERKMTEDKLKEAVRQAKESNALKSSFLANMSHEIRTPLAAILGFTDLLRESPMSAEDRDKYFEIIHRNGEQLSNLINDILDLSKVESGQIEVERLPVNIRQLVQEMISNFPVPAKKKDIRMELTFDASVPNLIGTDPTRLSQILNNILGNAFKFTEQGSVRVNVFCKDRKVHLLVTDTGIGMTEDQMRKLFHPFTQADQSTTRKFGGTGLGLVLSKRLAQALGGDISIQSSAPGRGSVFEITIEDRLEGDANLNGLSILVVDDSADNREWVSKVLKEKRARVDTSDNGLIGIQKALRENFDLILMDLQMPDMDGFSAIEKLRAGGYKKPIIALTIFSKNEVYSKCLNVGCTDQITKPVKPSELTRIIGRYTHGI